MLHDFFVVDRFHTVSFTMQLHDQKLTLSLNTCKAIHNGYIRGTITLAQSVYSYGLKEQICCYYGCILNVTTVQVIKYELHNRLNGDINCCILGFIQMYGNIEWHCSVSWTQGYCIGLYSACQLFDMLKATSASDGGYT